MEILELSDERKYLKSFLRSLEVTRFSSKAFLALRMDRSSGWQTAYEYHSLNVICSE
ncbi:hypothetical protein HHI36_004052, partial [Cryptolaemus montrouzieri]